ncbi:unnamed protein product [Moneuplotes crassus]|uniref:Uncharacterized protein n=1 Tax=Euplotes crassus TaxID=5936 RepID=A0AAD1U0B0_EUPCR|nr:unnamed protein product [Moneuplotes crassus]
MKMPALKRKLRAPHKLLRVIRKKLLSQNPRNQSFNSKSKKISWISRNQNSVCKVRSLSPKKRSTKRNFHRNTQRSKKISRISAKSPLPKHNLKILCTPADEEFEQEQERYIAIIKKAQDAVGKSPRWLDSPRVLRKFLSDRELLMDKEHHSEGGTLPSPKEVHSSQDSGEELESHKIKNSGLCRKKLSAFAPKKFTFNSNLS